MNTTSARRFVETHFSTPLTLTPSVDTETTLFAWPGEIQTAIACYVSRLLQPAHQEICHKTFYEFYRYVADYRDSIQNKPQQAFFITIDLLIIMTLWTEVIRIQPRFAFHYFTFQTNVYPITLLLSAFDALADLAPSTLQPIFLAKKGTLLRTYPTNATSMLKHILCFTSTTCTLEEAFITQFMQDCQTDFKRLDQYWTHLLYQQLPQLSDISQQFRMACAMGYSHHIDHLLQADPTLLWTAPDNEPPPLSLLISSRCIHAVLTALKQVTQSDIHLAQQSVQRCLRLMYVGKAYNVLPALLAIQIIPIDLLYTPLPEQFNPHFSFSYDQTLWSALVNLSAEPHHLSHSALQSILATAIVILITTQETLALRTLLRTADIHLLEVSLLWNVLEYIYEPTLTLQSITTALCQALSTTQWEALTHYATSKTSPFATWLKRRQTVLAEKRARQTTHTFPDEILPLPEDETDFLESMIDAPTPQKPKTRTKKHTNTKKKAAESAQKFAPQPPAQLPLTAETPQPERTSSPPPELTPVSTHIPEVTPIPPSTPSDTVTDLPEAEPISTPEITPVVEHKMIRETTLIPTVWHTFAAQITPWLNTPHLPAAQIVQVRQYMLHLMHYITDTLHITLPTVSARAGRAFLNQLNFADIRAIERAANQPLLTLLDAFETDPTHHTVYHDLLQWGFKQMALEPYWITLAQHFAHTFEVFLPAEIYLHPLEPFHIWLVTQSAWHPIALQEHILELLAQMGYALCAPITMHGITQQPEYILPMAVNGHQPPLQLHLLQHADNDYLHYLQQQPFGMTAVQYCVNTETLWFPHPHALRDWLDRRLEWLAEPQVNPHTLALAIKMIAKCTFFHPQDPVGRQLRETLITYRRPEEVVYSHALHFILTHPNGWALYPTQIYLTLLGNRWLDSYNLSRDPNPVMINHCQQLQIYLPQLSPPCLLGAFWWILAISTHPSRPYKTALSVAYQWIIQSGLQHSTHITTQDLYNVQQTLLPYIAPPQTTGYYP